MMVRSSAPPPPSGLLVAWGPSSMRLALGLAREFEERTFVAD
jgi:hypothetical protein